MNNNYILARWRDVITDPPPNGWKGHVSREERNGTVHQYCTEYMTNPHSFEFQGERRVFCAVRPGDQWLDITATPGVARTQVQAAIKRIKDVQEMARGNDEYVAFGTAVDVIEEYTEVTP
jgi:hypothetical protein